jgi:predicted transcriptional regulator
MKYHLSKIREHSSYSINQASKLLKVNRKTIFRWIQEGLPLLDENRRPRLIMGYDLKAFIKASREAKKIKLQPDEFVCFRCKKAVKAKEGTLKLEKTGKKIGKNGKDQKRLRGDCEECGGKVFKFISNK